MNLKQHNDIVQKLLQQIQLKDKELAKLNKEIVVLGKVTSGGGGKVGSVAQQQKQTQKRITQLTKQHNAKLASLNQEIKSLTQENNQLKERLSLKSSLEQKEKEHIVEVIKKNVDRKPGSQHDIKITALVTHYQSQLTKKNNFIQTLKRQIKSLSLNTQPSTNTSTTSKNSIQQPFSSTSPHSITLTQHTKIVEKLQHKLHLAQQATQGINKELADMRSKYNELTKEYYRVVNQYGIGVVVGMGSDKRETGLVKGKGKQEGGQQGETGESKKNNFVSRTTNKSNKSKGDISAKDEDVKLSFLLSEDQFGFEKETNTGGDNGYQQYEASISVDFEENFKRFNNRPKVLLGLNQQQQEEDEEQQEQQDEYQNQNKQIKQHQQNQNFSKKHPSQSPSFQSPSHPSPLLPQLLSLLQLSSPSQILPTITHLLTQLSFTPINEIITQRLSQLLYSFGMGKVAKSEMLEVLDVFQKKCKGWVEADQLMGEVCIELGAKRAKVVEKIGEFKREKEGYISNLQNLTFLSSLHKSHKLLQFIDFFQLDKSDLHLPQQLKNIHQQLKIVDRFIKMVNKVYDDQVKDLKGIEEVLNFVMGKLEKYRGWEYQLEKENQRKQQKKRQLKQQVRQSSNKE